MAVFQEKGMDGNENRAFSYGWWGWLGCCLAALSRSVGLNI